MISRGDTLRDIERIISELEQQRSAIERALTALHEITGSSTISAARAPRPAAKKKRRMSAAGRERIAEAVRKRWAATKSGQAAPVSKKVVSAKKTARKKRRAKKAVAKATAAATPAS
jgi:hypothetical protein